MKKILLLILLLNVSFNIFASHIVGGEVFYTYLGPGTEANTSRYTVSLRLFRDCNVQCNVNNVACLPNVAIVSIFQNTALHGRAATLNVALQSSQQLTLTGYPACISSRPSVCYEVKTYSAEVTLDDNFDGYILAYQNCCRAQVTNVIDDAGSVNGSPGVTYDCIMPGRNTLSGGVNSSATFNLKDTALVCYSSQFTLDFSATDADGDSLSYEFVPAYQSNPAFTASNDDLPAYPPSQNGYDTVTYRTGYYGLAPLGKEVKINSVTGIISGISPSSPGKYVVAVVVKEWRNGVQIGEHRKDFIMRVENCNVPSAELAPSYITCDGFDLSFRNNSSSPIITSYYWDFGVEGTDADTSVSPTPTYVYSDSGSYTITLITNRGQQCTDTATAVAKVYPGFIPDFTVNGSCVVNPYQFTDRTTSQYGNVDSWRWDFGETTTLADTSLLQNPSYRYSNVQSPNVRLIVTNSKGCVDTITKPVTISDRPTVDLTFRDTLICVLDTLTLNASSTSSNITYSWSPNYNIINPSSATPQVYPKTTTVYNVTINNQGCVATDSVKVNVIPFVILELGQDTTICLTDAIQMFPNTNALYFSWTPTTGIDNPSIKNPFITPAASSATYNVVASVGKCNATDNITIRTVPYPAVNAGADTSICYGTTASIVATTEAPNYSWSPLAGLVRATTLTPLATPFTTTSYIISVTDNLGCPKPVSDTIVVTVIPPVPAFAGRDTTIVVNQPLQLNASGGAIYSWSPSTGMSDPNIPNPVVTLGSQYDSITYRVLVSTPEGCSATDDIKVIVFKTNPSIIVPSAFTPNADGQNDIIRPKIVGMKQYNYFRIYNRAGQMLYSTSTQDQGWDGRFGGELQPPGAYVYVAEAIDYTGKVVLKKGTVVLIR